ERAATRDAGGLATRHRDDVVRGAAELRWTALSAILAVVLRRGGDPPAPGRLPSRARAVRGGVGRDQPGVPARAAGGLVPDRQGAAHAGAPARPGRGLG